MKKWLGIIILILGFGGGVYWALPKLMHHDFGEGDAAGPKVARVLQTNVTFVVSAAGDIEPAERVSVRPEINGRIAELPVDIGDRVKKGQLLFKLDDKELRNQYESIKTQVERARLQLEQAQRDYERAKKLREAGLIAQETFDQAKTSYELAKNALQQAEKELAVVAERLTKTEVRAPFDCTVLTRSVSVGQAVSGAGGFNAGTEVLTIADLSRLIIRAHVNQADVPYLKLGQKVEVSVEAVPGLVVTGVVERIAPQATIKNNIKGFETRILLENPDPRIKPGMTASIRIPVASATNVVAVPLAAVYTERNPKRGQWERYVYVRRPDGKFERRFVKVGVSDYFYAEIQSGLQPGEVVAIEPPPDSLLAPEQPTMRPKGPAPAVARDGRRPRPRPNQRG